MPSHDTRYRKITSVLENRIRAGVYAPGRALPPRVELMAEFAVARATIDRCIGELRRKNLVTSRHGSGTFVKEELYHPHRIALVGFRGESFQLPEEWQIDLVSERDLEHKSDWNRLLDYDGIIWFLPSDKLYPAIAFTHGSVPQVTVNRTLPDEVCVSTDHRGAYYEITRERLDALPSSPVFLLTSARESSPLTYREAGFIDACRAAQRFYEILTLPDDFEAKLAALESLPLDSGKPLLLVSTSQSNTGAVMWFARSHELAWRRDLWYSDFDNNHTRDSWGVRVTSYIQNYKAMQEGAVTTLRMMLEGETPPRQHTLIFPERREGDT